jgi:hypothetical protein
MAVKHIMFRVKSRLQAAMMRFLRSVIEVTRRDKIKNDIRNKVHMESLNDTVKNTGRTGKTTYHD